MTLTRFDKAGYMKDFFQIVDNRIAGRLVVDASGSGNMDLTNEQADNAQLVFTGTLTGNKTVIVPDYPMVYHVQNLTTGTYTLTVKTLSGTGVPIQQANLPDHPRIKRVMVDGTDVVWADGGQLTEDNLHVNAPENGYYKKYASGEADCHLVLGSEDANDKFGDIESTLTAGALFRSAALIWYFPVVFLGGEEFDAKAGVVGGGWTSSSSNWVAPSGLIRGDRMPFRVYGHEPTSIFTIGVWARGKWK
ncbi:MAG: hypothetical protein FH749_06760 [Firmicutes bacterium]|nr:hypothetical protein [Bacillota bacterium]